MYQPAYKPNFEIITDQKAPVQQSHCSGTSYWRDLFESMKVGEWFILPKKHHKQTSGAASSYMRGRYRLYLHPTLEGYYVFAKTK